MGVMIRFESPYSKDENPVTIGPFPEVELNDGGVWVGEQSMGYFDPEQQAWTHNGKLYDSVKIFAASSVVPA